MLNARLVAIQSNFYVLSVTYSLQKHREEFVVAALLFFRIHLQLKEGIKSLNLTANAIPLICMQLFTLFVLTKLYRMSNVNADTGV